MKGKLKLSDFGLSVRASSRRESYCGTPDYMALEMLSGDEKGHYAAVDCWSTGIVLFEMLTRLPPFLARSKEGKSMLEECSISYPSYVTPDARLLISQVLSRNSGERLTMTEIVNHQWVRENASRYERVSSSIRSASPTSPVSFSFVATLAGDYVN